MNKYKFWMTAVAIALCTMQAFAQQPQSCLPAAVQVNTSAFYQAGGNAGLGGFLDYITINHNTGWGGANVVSGGPGLRVSLTSPGITNRFGQFVIIDNTACLYSTLVTQNDVLLRSGLDAEDLVLSTQNTFGSIRFGTTRALTQPGAVTDLERMTILNDGNVGIGTMNPFYSAFATPLPIQSLLQVGNISINPVTFEGAIRRRGSIAFNSFNDPLTGIPKSVESGPVNGITFIPSEGTENLLNGGVRLFASNTVAANTAYDNLGTLTLKPGALELESQLGLLMRYKFPVGTVQTYNDDATLYIKDKVYIGAEEMLEGVHPPFDEDGFYKLAVKGSILASEIVVDGRPEMWPDYVFEASYELLPIEHLANKVRSEKHLPGIPSAVEIGKSGITLGEMQGKLLKKIEELTLYVIQLNEENKALSQRLQHLEKSN